MNFKEIEFKYNAENVSLAQFKEFCKGRNPEKALFASGYDHFYEKTNDSESFCRHRVGPDVNQLTFKRKTVNANSFVRTEHNIDVLPSTSREQIEALCGEFGYTYNFSIFKSAFVYKYDWHTFVYYIVYDLEMKETGRFVEIEMAEDYSWVNEQEAWNQLLVLEKLCKSIGLVPQARIKRSLFELYKK